MAHHIQVLPLGAGQDVGRSCVVVKLGGRQIMFDCGMHMGYRDHRRFPDFSLLSPAKRYSDVIDAIIITHFHLDHCGALPYFTEVCGYDGPIYMTYPTKAIMPIMLEDYHKVMTERQGDRQWFTRQHITDCMKKVIGIDLQQHVQVDAQFEFRAYYAGHVLGAAMFYVRVGNQSIVYTGDYNTTPDRHLGAAHIERLRPDLLISESTYATTLRDSKKTRERDFINAVHETVQRGGKVLIPVFAVGRAQELQILLDEYWERMNLKVPIYFSSSMAQRANLYYRLLLNWTNRRIRSAEARHSAFTFARMQPWSRELVNAEGPCVLFATPGMLHGGVSLEVFKAWAGHADNLVVLPGYQLAGTLGSRLMSGNKEPVEVDRATKLEVKCKVSFLAFSAHADAKGILQLVQQCAPRVVMLVHGEKAKMQFLGDKISRMFGVPCHSPANGEIVTIPTEPTPLPVRVTEQLLQQCMQDLSLAGAAARSAIFPEAPFCRWAPPPSSVVVQGVLVARKQPGQASVQTASGKQQQQPQHQQLQPSPQPPQPPQPDVPSPGQLQQAAAQSQGKKPSREERRKQQQQQQPEAQDWQDKMPSISSAVLMGSAEAQRSLALPAFQIRYSCRVAMPCAQLSMQPTGAEPSGLVPEGMSHNTMAAASMGGSSSLQVDVHADMQPAQAFKRARLLAPTAGVDAQFTATAAGGGGGAGAAACVAACAAGAAAAEVQAASTVSPHLYSTLEDVQSCGGPTEVLRQVQQQLQAVCGYATVQQDASKSCVSVSSFVAQLQQQQQQQECIFDCTWLAEDDMMATMCIRALTDLRLGGRLSGSW